MKRIITILLLMTTLSAFAQKGKTLVKTLDPEGATTVSFNFNYEKLIHKKWSEKFVRIQMEIHTNMSESILNELIKVGRYNLEGSRENDVYIINAPKLQKKLTIGGKAIEEFIHLNVDIPEFLSISEGQIKHSSSFKNKNPRSARSFQIVVEYLAVSSDYTFKYSLAKTVSNPTSVVKKMHHFTRSLNLQELEKLFGEIRLNGERLTFN